MDLLNSFYDDNKAVISFFFFMFCVGLLVKLYSWTNKE